MRSAARWDWRQEKDRRGSFRISSGMGTFFYGTDLFGSYEEWFVETMKIACANPHVNWIVKIHPANIVKNVRDGVRPSRLN